MADAVRLRLNAAAGSDYPRWKYHPNQQARVVNDAFEDMQLGPEWKNVPCGRNLTAEESVHIATGAARRSPIAPIFLAGPPTTLSLVRTCDNKPVLFSSLTLLSDAQR
jgi:hypothetical protein